MDHIILIAAVIVVLLALEMAGMQLILYVYRIFNRQKGAGAVERFIRKWFKPLAEGAGFFIPFLSICRILVLSVCLGAMLWRWF